jgi:hypothetical protein
VDGLLRAAEATVDGEFLGAALRALERTPEADARRARLAHRAAAVQAALGIRGVTPKAPRALAEVQTLYPVSHKVPDRLLLSIPDVPAAPYLGLYAMDRTETLFHGHEDNRGEVYHFEVDGTVYLRRSGWFKWAAGANTFVVAPELAQFPFALTRGIAPGRWYVGSGNAAHLRDFMESGPWRRTDKAPREQGQHALWDTATDQGYAWANPDGMAGKHDTVTVESITIRVVSLPTAEALNAEAKRDHQLNGVSFEPGLFWYREYRAVIPNEGDLELLVSRPRFAGMQGAIELIDFANLPETTKVLHYPVGSRGKPANEIPRSQWEKWLQIAPNPHPSGSTALRLRCPPGRLDLVIPVAPVQVDIVKTQPRIELDYQILSENRSLLRAPLAVLVNGLRPRSIYLDHQQGGRLTSSRAEPRESDRYGELRYENLYGAGSTWVRRTVLTAEGVLVVVDGFTSSAGMGSVAGGPVWQLQTPPDSGLNWFSAAIAPGDTKRLLVYFHAEAGQEMGTQFIPKLFEERDHAVFARRLLKPGRTEWFLSVLIPHDASLPAGELTNLKNTMGRLRDAPQDRLGINSALESDGRAVVRVGPRDKRWPHAPITIEISANGEWIIRRENR